MNFQKLNTYYHVIGRVVEVKDFGATLNLLEFPDRKAFVHISEVASGWVKYIRDFIREGQMVVAKITRVKEFLTYYHILVVLLL